MAKVALLIGVSEYEPGLNPLPAAVKDIEALRRVLQDPEMGGFDQVKTLANPDRQAMESEIELLVDGRAKDDLVLLFFSGHGIKDDASTLYFASRNTRKNAKGDLIRSTAVAAIPNSECLFCTDRSVEICMCLAFPFQSTSPNLFSKMQTSSDLSSL